MLTREQFVKLAEAVVEHDNYAEDLRKCIIKTAKKHGQDVDFLGLPMQFVTLEDAIVDILGSDFSYWMFDCNQSFEKFNNRITFKDGSHPDVSSFDDLYDFAVEEGSLK